MIPRWLRRCRCHHEYVRQAWHEDDFWLRHYRPECRRHTS